MITTVPMRTNPLIDMSAETANEQQAACWDGVDGIVVINMESHPERWEEFQRGPGAWLPADRLHRLNAVVGVEVPGYGQAPWFTERTGERSRFWGGTAGCALSHRRAVEMARDKGWRQVLILEDDAVLSPVTPDADRLIVRALRLTGRYMLYLGFNKPRPYGRPAMVEGEVQLWQIEGVLATHAYLVPEAMYGLMLNVLPREENVWEWLARYRAIDTFYKDYLSMMPGVRTYAVMPQLIHQADVASCISGQTTGGVDYSCQGLPLLLDSPAGFWHRLCKPLRKLKIRLNSLRTLMRARRGGLPGKRRRS